MLNKSIKIFKTSVLLISGIYDLLKEDLKRRKLGHATEMAFEISRKQSGFFPRKPQSWP